MASKSKVFDCDVPCSVEELQDIITAPSGGYTLSPNSAYDEVHPGIYIGEGDSAKSVGCMRRLGITHVLNAAQGKSQFHVNTSHETYQRAGIEYLGVEATDFLNCDMSRYFDQAATYIHQALQAGGKVFVHCVQGISRSATLVLAYLMLRGHMTVQDAVRSVRAHREICPNEGFLQQLCDLNERLKRTGHFDHLIDKQGCIDDQRTPMGVTNISCKSTIQNENSRESESCQNFAQDGRHKNVGQDEHRQKIGHDESCKDVAQFATHTRFTPDLCENCVEVVDISPCTVEELEAILTEPSGGFMMLPSRPFDQIDNFIYIGEGAFARNVIGLKKLGITHVLNCAHHKGVNSDENKLRQESIVLQTVQAEDRMGFDLSPFFNVAADFIDSAIATNGRVFVHCVEGVSRSATLVVAYYMLKRHMTAREAVHLVRVRREICPNSHFLQQLCDLDAKLGTMTHFEPQLRKKCGAVCLHSQGNQFQM